MHFVGLDLAFVGFMVNPNFHQVHSCHISSVTWLSNRLRGGFATLKIFHIELCRDQRQFTSLPSEETAPRSPCGGMSYSVWNQNEAIGFTFIFFSFDLFNLYLARKVNREPVLNYNDGLCQRQQRQHKTCIITYMAIKFTQFHIQKWKLQYVK